VGKTVLLVVLGYFLGGIPSAYVITKLVRGIDIREIGSGNVGATNTLRVLGLRCAVLVMLLDFAKGYLAASLGLNIGGGSLTASLSSAAAVIGHCYSPYLKGTGGKGVAASGGVIICLMPVIAVWLAAIFVLTVLVKRIVSVGSIAIAIAFPILTAFYKGIGDYFYLSLFMAVLVIYRHRANIERLIKGTEPRLGEKVV